MATTISAGLIRSDAAAIPLADESVDLVVTSPPYFALRSYTDDGEHYDGQIGSEPTPAEFLAALWAVTAECKRVLKPSGSMFVNLGDKYAGSAGWCSSEASAESSTLADKGRQQRQTHGEKPRTPKSHIRPKSLMGLPWRYAIGCIGALTGIDGPDLGLDLILRAEILWSKPNGLPESVTDRVRRSHEQWFHFTKEPRYFSAVDEIREPYRDGNFVANGHQQDTHARTQKANTTGYDHTEHMTANPLGRRPGSVWTVPLEPLTVPDSLGVDHFAAFPQEWPRRFILGWSPSGICVECGEGRRPVTAKEAAGEPRGQTETDKFQRARSAVAGGQPTATDVRYSIEGYECGCDDERAPTRPAVVLDPFVGTGTTVMVARALGRTGVGLDLSADYLRLASWRVFESGHATKTMRRTNEERQGRLL